MMSEHGAIEPTWESKCGRVKLWLGDWIELKSTVAPLADSLVTDPPYGISYSPGRGGGGILRADGSKYAKKFTGKDLVIGDNRHFDPKPLLDLNIPSVIWGGNHFASRLPDTRFWLVWDKRDGTTTNDFADGEIAWTNQKGNVRIFRHMWNGMLKDSERGEERLHPTQKPIAVMIWCMRSAGIGLGTVFDPYMGSAGTAIACIRTGRNFVGCEIDPTHFATAVKRIEKELSQGVLFDAPK